MLTKREPKVSIELRDRMFACYYATPSVSHVSRRCDVSRRTVMRWRERDRWRERAAQISGEQLAQNIISVDEMKGRVERIITALMANFLERVESGAVQIETPADLVTVGRFWLTLKGEAAEIGRLELLPSGTPVDHATPVELKEAAAGLLGVTEGFERRLAIVEAEAEVMDGQNGNGKGGS